MPRRRDDDATSNWRRTRVQPPNPQTINGNPSLRIREKLPTCQTVRLHMCSCRYFENMSPKTIAVFIAPQTAVTSLSSVSPRQRGQRRQLSLCTKRKASAARCDAEHTANHASSARVRSGEQRCSSSETPPGGKAPRGCRAAAKSPQRRCYGAFPKCTPHPL